MSFKGRSKNTSQEEMLHGLTKRKILRLGMRQGHKKCAELLRAAYLELLQGRTPSLTDYETLLSWLSLNPFTSLNPKLIADRMHWHLDQAGLTLKEHNLLPRLRTGDREARTGFGPIGIYLDQIRSAYNVGSILRTNEALRIGTVYFSSRTPYIDNEKVIRTAMGAAEIVPCIRNPQLSDLPRPIFVLDTSDEAVPLNEVHFPESFTLVLGNEEVGVSDELLAISDAIIEIPLLGAKNSLNVACAFAIAAARFRSC